MDPVVHFEMAAGDSQRMAAFYAKIFGWQTKVMGEDMGGYVVVTTTENDPATGRPKQPGAINGGFYDKKRSKFPPVPSIVIAVDDVQAKMKMIEAEGCKILTGPDVIPGIGTYVSFEDTEGNRVSLLQPSSDMTQAKQ